MSYKPRTKPRAHQAIADKLLTSHDNFAVLAEMGTGKSKMICDDFGRREAAGDIQDLLIVAPAGSYMNWIEDKNDDQVAEFKKHMSKDLYERLAQVAWVSGPNKSQQKDLIDLLKYRDGPRALMVNVEALSSVEAAQIVSSRFLDAKGRRSMMVIDESTAIRGHDSQRTIEVIRLGRLAKVRRILTGLVTPNSPLDLYSQFEFLDWRILGHRSFHTFKMRYAVMKPITENPFAMKAMLAKVNFGKPAKRKAKTIMTVVGYRNPEELQALIAPYSYRVLKEDCLDLPPKIYQRREVELTKKQTKMYADLKKFATAELDAITHVTATAVITRLLRLHQLVCGHIVDEEGEIHNVPNNRITEMMELLAEHSGKAIIWANYHQSINKIVEAVEKEYGEGSIAQFHGKNRTTRGEDEKRFLSDPNCRFMLASQKAGGKGNTWVNASLVVYFSNDYDLEARMQSEDRSHRDGLKHAVTYVDLVCPGTIDELILKALRKKINMSTTINGENYREWLI